MSRNSAEDSVKNMKARETLEDQENARDRKEIARDRKKTAGRCRETQGDTGRHRELSSKT